VGVYIYSGTLSLLVYIFIFTSQGGWTLERTIYVGDEFQHSLSKKTTCTFKKNGWTTREAVE
jgi:hypothetical protein